MLQVLKRGILVLGLVAGAIGVLPSPADAAPRAVPAVAPVAVVQPVQYAYGPPPYAYRRPYYARPEYRPYPRHYARRHWGPPPHAYGRPYDRYYGGRRW